MKYFVPLLLLIAVSHADEMPNFMLWEASVSIDTSHKDPSLVVNESTSYMITSQDFQSLVAPHISNSLSMTKERIVYDFGEGCFSSNLTLEKIQQMNYNGIKMTNGIKMADGMSISNTALVKRGGCNWREKYLAVNRVENITIADILIYDNISYGNEIKINKLPASGSGYLELPKYSSPLPAYRSISNMSDNDLQRSLMHGSATLVFFIPNIYGRSLINRIKQTNNTLNSSIGEYWSLITYWENASWGSATNYESFFKFNNNYIIYIICSAAIFIFGVSLFRYWALRQSRNYRPYDTEMQIQRRRSVSDTLDPLPVEIVNRLPVDKYSKDLLKNETCVICLEDFTSGKDDVRILPCGHGFCVLCIDPWFTQKSCLCPICKWDCLPIDIRNQRDLEKKLYNANRSLAREGQDDNNSESNNTIGNEPGSSTGRNSYIEDHNSTLLSTLNASTIVAIPSDLNRDTNTHESVSTDSLTNTNNEQSNSSRVDLSNHTDKKEERN